MTRYKINIEYDGTDLIGWQENQQGPSVQSLLQDSIFQFCGEKVTVFAAGRTDAGVHALKQYFHYVSNKEKDLNQLAYALNKMLPEDIKILSLKEVNDDFHSRYSVKQKIYEYRILLTNKDPFNDDLAYVYPLSLDVALLEKALKKFEGTHNYQDFTSKEEDEDNFIRTIYSVNIFKEDNLLKIRFTGNGFMRYQIRDMIGTAIAVAAGKESLDFIDKHLLDNKVKREIISYKSPACGLYLVDVIY